MEGRYVVVTTEHRGVFFGKLEVYNLDAGTAELSEARNCIYWSRDVRGFLGLAAVGPIGDSRVGAAVGALELVKITSVSACSPEAVEQWKAK